MSIEEISQDAQSAVEEMKQAIKRHQCRHENPHRKVVTTEHEYIHVCACGEIIARFCRHKDTAQHDGKGFEHLTLGEESIVGCSRCEVVLWGVHRHVLHADHGDPHYMGCEDCGIVLGTRQLPPGVSIDKLSGHICKDCFEGRTHQNEREEAVKALGVELEASANSSARPR